MPHLSSEVWAIAIAVVILWFAIAQAAGRIVGAISSLKVEMDAVEMHLRDAPWIEAKARRDEHYWHGGNS
jgi:hypothetical protein